MDIYLVGGAVRDQLLGLEVFDKDWVVVGATPQALEEQGFKLVGQEFPVFIHPQTSEEYALARTERKAGKGYKGFEYLADPSVTLEQDLIRRDLTINAIAQDGEGKLYDYYGGMDDLANRLLRHVSPAFSEDPLRVLRVARFCARFDPLGFTVAPETLDLMSKIAQSDELSHLTIERVWKETERALSEPSPWRFFEVLHQCGALDQLFPELLPLFNDPSATERFKNTAINLTKTANAPALRFAAAIVLALPNEPKDQKADAALSFCLRLKTPKVLQEIVKIAMRGYPDVTQPHQLNEHQLLELLTCINSLRKPDNINTLLDLTNALDPKTQVNNAWWQKLAKQVSNVNPAPFVQAGLKGAQIGIAIEQERIKRCQHSLAALTHSGSDEQ